MKSRDYTDPVGRLGESNLRLPPDDGERVRILVDQCLQRGDASDRAFKSRLQTVQLTAVMPESRMTLTRSGSGIASESINGQQRNR